MNKYIVFALMVFLAGCATSTSTPVNDVSTKAPVSSTSKQGSSDGLSFETAIEFPTAKTSFEGIPMEYEWLSKHYPNARKTGQSIVENGNDLYDAIEIETADGEKKTIYFKMTNWFGM